MYIHNLDPVILEFGVISLRWYSLSYVAGILFGWWYGKKIISRLRIEIEIQHGLIKGYQDEASENYVLGIYQENELFAGTDKLSMAVQPDAIKFIKNKEFKHLLIEGDRLFKPSFIKECYNVTNNVRVIILKVGEMTLKNRHKQTKEFYE